MDNYLEHGKANPNLEFLKTDSFKKPIRMPQRKEDMYLSGYGRQWGESLTYSTGIAYGTGMMFGGSYGFLRGVAKGGATRRLFLNSILNSCSTHGPVLANRFAAVTMLYCGFSGLLGLALKDDKRYKAPIAGALSGFLYKVAGNGRSRGIYAISSSVLFTAADYVVRNNYF